MQKQKHKTKTEINKKNGGKGKKLTIYNAKHLLSMRNENEVAYLFWLASPNHIRCLFGISQAYLYFSDTLPLHRKQSSMEQ